MYLIRDFDESSFLGMDGLLSVWRETDGEGGRVRRIYAQDSMTVELCASLHGSFGRISWPLALCSVWWRTADVTKDIPVFLGPRKVLH
jgi:hypothetical protein